jgi:hypothetical protein
VSWDREFDDPVPGCRSLRDAAKLIMALPKAEQELPHWKAAIEALILVAELEGDVLLARVGMLRALNHGKAEPLIPRKPKSYRIIR